MIASYVLGLGGQQVTELNAAGTWVHSNVYAGSALAATYDTAGTRFQLSDWLGSRRVQVHADGTVGLTCLSYPFGDGLNCTGADEDATEHHFTGKERDTRLTSPCSSQIGQRQTGFLLLITSGNALVRYDSDPSGLTRWSPE